jgi:hypothetical protein
MPRGLMIRVLCFLLGAFPVGSLLHLLNTSSEFAGLMVILYAVAGANYLAHYCVEHQDEISTRPERP